jgi:hypothetical protein
MAANEISECMLGLETPPAVTETDREHCWNETSADTQASGLRRDKFGWLHNFQLLLGNKIIRQAIKIVIPLRLANLSERHPGLTKAIGDSYAEAAAVCMHRHHVSPADVSAVVRDLATECILHWDAPSNGVLRAYANEIDTTEQGAYAVSLATTEAVVGLVAVSRAETMTGADYYVAPIGSNLEDLETCIRLEVSGVSAGSEAVVQARLRQKVVQTEKGKSNLPALAAVVGFKERLIAIAKLGDEQ